MDGFTVFHYSNPVVFMSQTFRPCAMTDLQKRTAETDSAPACCSWGRAGGGGSLAAGTRLPRGTLLPVRFHVQARGLRLLPTCVRMNSNEKRFFTCISAIPIGSQGTGAHGRCGVQLPAAVGRGCRAASLWSLWVPCVTSVRPL